MKGKILRVGKIALPILAISFYILNFITSFQYIMPSPPPTTVLSLLLSILFFVSDILLLWIFRKNQGVLWFSLVISALSTLAVIYAWIPLAVIDVPGVMELNFMVVVSLYGFTFFPFMQGNGFKWLLTIAVILLFVYKLILLILLKINIRHKKRRQTNETT